MRGFRLGLSWLESPRHHLMQTNIKLAQVRTPVPLEVVSGGWKFLFMKSSST
jgi:hypothetical protein